jgi:hypothetical protein
MGPTIAMGSTKAQGSKVKPVYGSEPPRATSVRDEATQRMANIHQGDPAPSIFISESRLGGFLHAPMWTGIYPSGFSARITRKRSVKPLGPDLMGGALDPF